MRWTRVPGQHRRSRTMAGNRVTGHSAHAQKARATRPGISKFGARSAASRPKQGYLAQALTSSHTTVSMPARVLLLSLLSAALFAAAAPSGVEARDVRELLTPHGWEEARSAARPKDMALDDDELLVPSNWRVGQSCAPDLRVGSELCSELLVPADWSALLREHAARPHA